MFSCKTGQGDKKLLTKHGFYHEKDNVIVCAYCKVTRHFGDGVTKTHMLSCGYVKLGFKDFAKFMGKSKYTLQLVPSSNSIFELFHKAKFFMFCGVKVDRGRTQ
jgi:hypothetical protein